MEQGATHEAQLRTLQHPDCDPRRRMLRAECGVHHAARHAACNIPIPQAIPAAPNAPNAAAAMLIPRAAQHPTWRPSGIRTYRRVPRTVTACNPTCTAAGSVYQPSPAPADTLAAPSLHGSRLALRGTRNAFLYARMRCARSLIGRGARPLMGSPRLGPQALMSTWNPTTVVTQLEFVLIMTASATALVIAVALVPIQYRLPPSPELPHPFPYTMWTTFSPCVYSCACGVVTPGPAPAPARSCACACECVRSRACECAHVLAGLWVRACTCACFYTP